jgi:hypothetical protein
MGPAHPRPPCASSQPPPEMERRMGPPEAGADLPLWRLLVLPVGRQKAEKPRRSSPPPPLAAAERRGDGRWCAPRGLAAPRARRRRICPPPCRSPASNRERSRRGRAPTSQGSTSTSPDPARRAQGSTSTASVRETGEGGVGGERAPGQGEEGPASPSCSLWE